MSSMKLQNASNFLSKGFSIVDAQVGAFQSKVPAIQSSLASLNHKSSMYPLQKIALDEQVTRMLNEMKNARNLLASFVDRVQQASSSVRDLESKVSQLKADHEWAMARFDKKIVLSISNVFNRTMGLLSKPIKYLQHNPDLLVQAAVGAALVSAFCAGYLCARGS